MSETKSYLIPASTRKKLLEISKIIPELNTGNEKGELWLASDQGGSSYDWGQTDLGINKDGMLLWGEQGGCSCYGPEEPSADTTFSLSNTIRLEADDDYYNTIEPCIKELVSTTNSIYTALFNTERLKPKDVISIANAEIRRAVVERIGYEKIVKEAKILDDTESDGRLLQIPLEDDEDITLLYVKDPSTDREYFLRVPPNMKTAKEARAWTFGFHADDFNLELET